MRSIRNTWKYLSIFIGMTVVLVFVAALCISSYYGYAFSTVSFYLSLFVLVIGIFFSMEGRSFGNRFVVPGNSFDAVNATLELERESQDIKNQGPVKYVLENRIMKFKQKPFAFIISGLISLAITYFIS
ncbi:hypothetical protein BVG16_27175 [Paenibacillus selenitireducens]|uniref:DUF3899 domain-containing protein n=1 Tax=Paenibacillus selenitireducens TaxID=1324314 RepID=A0A1T2X1K0_9BACL|nr:hypothetical protein [Paenibacillus selenitireducens]OPA73768.1 hypothetical protein BVG16_27175 [Paenibacillus selenitireducens]